jgi:branched-chain amino acid transport system substrate-binding protein
LPSALLGYLLLTSALQLRRGATDDDSRRSTRARGTPASEADVILVGEVGSLTGADAEFGISTRNGIELAINEANASAGVRGRPLALRVYDDLSTPEGAARATRRLVADDHVALILGEVASSNSLAMAPIAQSARVPMVTPASTNPAVTEQGDYVFRTCFSDLFQGLVMARYAHETLKLQKVAVLVESQSVYSEGLAREFERRFKELGGEVVVEASYRKGDTAFPVQLAAIGKTGARGIYLPGYVAEIVRISQQARQLGLTATLLGGDAWDSEKLFETGGGWINGALITNHYSAEDPAVHDFVLRYKDAFGVIPDANAALGYDAARVAVDAMKRAPDLSGPVLRDALARTRDFIGVTGTITIDEKRNAVKPAVVLGVQDGRFKYLETVKP